MPTFEYQGKKIRVDEEGYLENFEEEGANKECPLRKEQIGILKFIREYYKKFSSVPVVRAVCINVHQPKSCEYIEFPDPVTTCKIAGIPKLDTGYELM